MRLANLNGLSREQFTATLGAIFEHSPWVAECAWDARPFVDLSALHAAMCACVEARDDPAKLGLIRAHPQLAGKAAMRGELSASSQREQNAAGLDQCSAQELAQLTALGKEYDSRFGFPFILAVTGHSRQSIIETLAERIGNTRDDEIAEALRQIERIALLRLRATIDDCYSP